MQPSLKKLLVVFTTQGQDLLFEPYKEEYPKVFGGETNTRAELTTCSCNTERGSLVWVFPGPFMLQPPSISKIQMHFRCAPGACFAKRGFVAFPPSFPYKLWVAELILTHLKLPNPLCQVIYFSTLPSLLFIHQLEAV